MQGLTPSRGAILLRLLKRSSVVETGGTHQEGKLGNAGCGQHALTIPDPRRGPIGESALAEPPRPQAARMANEGMALLVERCVENVSVPIVRLYRWREGDDWHQRW